MVVQTIRAAARESKGLPRWLLAITYRRRVVAWDRPARHHEFLRRGRESLTSDTVPVNLDAMLL
jgi:hypothetical protein